MNVKEAEIFLQKEFYRFMLEVQAIEEDHEGPLELSPKEWADMFGDYLLAFKK